MLPQNFTTKSQEALQIAHQLAQQNGQQSLEPIHLFYALLEQEDGVVSAILKKLAVNMAELKTGAEHLLARLPKIETSGALAQLYLSQDFGKMLQMAEQAAKHFKDEY
ncbi:MAG: Clp protease N-terminal domain-containing protein, partial [Candidatus Uhrbacteria bacterium]|nr:Clp protease N-terminal domain-containing protein [Candidatus Uhrbacteria bacterium]